MITAEYQMMNDLIDQVKLNSTFLRWAKKYAQTPEETKELETAIASNADMVEKAREALKDVPKQA
jgi:hypothetical protein